MSGIAPHGSFEIVLGHHAGMAFDDVGQDVVLRQGDGAMMAEDRANGHSPTIGRATPKCSLGGRLAHGENVAGFVRTCDQKGIEPIAFVGFVAWALAATG